jgi:hypothetical protein
MSSEKKTATILEDPKINIRIKLAALWVTHFLLWTFGDMVSLLQEITEPVSNELLLFVAAPLAVIQTFMILFSLLGEPKAIRWANIGMSLVFLVFNVGYLSEANAAWEYLLGMVYLLFNVLIIWFAWKWPKQEDSPEKVNS